MDLTPFKLDIDELVDDYTKDELTTLADMKRVWATKKFSYIYEARPSSNSAFFMQSLFSQAIGHMTSEAALSRRLGGLYCLYCLYETQPYKPCFKIYLSLGELRRLKILVIDSKQNDIGVVPALVKRMLDKHVFLFGFVDIAGGSIKQSVEDITKLQNKRVQIAYEKLLSNTRIEDYVHMDLGTELDLEALKKMSAEYAEAKESAVRGMLALELGTFDRLNLGEATKELPIWIWIAGRGCHDKLNSWWDEGVPYFKQWSVRDGANVTGGSLTQVADWSCCGCR